MLRRAWCIALVMVISCCGLLGVWRQASAASHGEYARWAVSGKTGTVALPDNVLPAGTFTSNSSTLRVPTGKSTFLNGATPFGAEFGSSQGEQYLSFGTAAKNQPSTTTITFGKPAPAGEWGFALGDIDADHVRIVARGSDGTTLTATDLGWQGAFNYCEGSPRPSTCTRGTESDRPTWDAATSTLVGSSTDTDGASGWFRPERAIKELSLIFSVQTGIPIGQLWIAARTPVVHPPMLIGLIVENTGDHVEPGVEVCTDLAPVLNVAPGKEEAASATGGRVLFLGSRLCWEGTVEPGFPVIITFPVPAGPLSPEEVIAALQRGVTVECAHGGRCPVKVIVTIREFCRAALGGEPERGAC